MPQSEKHPEREPSKHSEPRTSRAPEPADNGCCRSNMARRDFIKMAGAGSVAFSAWSSGLPHVAGPFAPSDAIDHFIPVEKRLNPEWVESLFARGESTWYRGEALKKIGMPIGGICAGQLYLAGDGRLTHWDIANQHHFTGYGSTSYDLDRYPSSPLEQGFALEVRTGDRKPARRTLDAGGFPDVAFCGEYPIGRVNYAADDCPVTVALEAFSPFIPLNEADSALPATVLTFTLKNTSGEPLCATLAGWLENGVSRHTGQHFATEWASRRVRRVDGEAVVHSSREQKVPPPARAPILLHDFEGPDYGDWKVEGEAFGRRPAGGTLPEQQKVRGFEGKGLVNTFLGGDGPHGKLMSPPFTIERKFIRFLIGGGNHAGKTCINLRVDGKIVRTATGKNHEKLSAVSWPVGPWEGKKATLEIVDAASGGWGHINIDRIEQADTPLVEASGPLTAQADFGTMALSFLGKDGFSHLHVSAESPLEDLFASEHASPESKADDEVVASSGQPPIGAVGKTVSLSPGEEKTLSFVLAWHFPNRPDRGEGNFYATRWADAEAVVDYVAENFQPLASETRRWHATWYDSTLPHWLLDRLFSTTANLATGTCQWWPSGRFWAWEGVGCCYGTCAHVWNYEHTMARLFPRLERSVREMQDFNPAAGFDEATGAVRFRGEGWRLWAGDSQAGTVLKAYREHLVSADDAFLKSNWPRIRKCLEFLLEQDQNADGLIEGRQHNTYDIDFYGPNTMVGSLYLAALRAAEEMARELGDNQFAATCRTVFEKGSKLSAERLYNGEYFEQIVDLEEHPKHQYADGCLSDQLFGQGWAHQVALGYLYPKEMVRSTLEAVWKYNWAPDVGPQNAAHAPERWFARPGEAGLFTCTWPKGKHLGPEAVRYCDEVWTGIEYQVAGNMVFEGLLTEALAICRAIHERYHPLKHNPWNEVECGDHYARAMASYGVLLALCGFEYHGPRQHIGFSPKLSPEDFRAAFVAAAGWGSYAQRRSPRRQECSLELKWGQLAVKTIAVEIPEKSTLGNARVTIAGAEVAAEAIQDGPRVLLTLLEAITLDTHQTATIELDYA